MKQNGTIFNLNKYQPHLSLRFCLKIKIKNLNSKCSSAAVLILFKFFSLKGEVSQIKKEKVHPSSFLFLAKLPQAKEVLWQLVFFSVCLLGWEQNN